MVKEGEVSKDNISWLEVECLGACVNAPAVQMNEDYYEDLNYENMTDLIKKIKGNKRYKSWISGWTSFIRAKKNGKK